MSSELSNNSNYCVYKHTAPNGKVYIGITHRKPRERWAGGFGYNTQIYFWRAIVKYGWDNFKHEILFDNISRKEAEQKEIELIQEYKSNDINHGYNIDLGHDHLKSKELREKMAEAKRGKKWSERRRLAAIEYFEHFQGRTVYKYDEKGNLVFTFNTVGAAARDAGVSPETLRSRLKHNKKHPKFKFYYSYGKFEDMGKPYENGNYVKAPVDMYDMSLNYLRTFGSLTEAGKFVGINGTGHINDVCKGKRLSCNGYIWRYHNENTDNKIA